MAEKVTQMVLKVDLQCRQCYKKIKKLLCKFPNIRDQVYDEKQNTVRITVICCSPEKIREKLWCKGGKTIKSIEIIEPPKPKPKVPEKPQVQPAEPHVEPPKKEPKKPEVRIPEPIVEPPKKEPEKPQVRIPEPTVELPKDTTRPPVQQPVRESKEPEKLAMNLKWIPKAPESGYPPAYPVGVCWEPWCQGYTGGPCYHGNGRLPQPPPSYVGYGYGYGYCGRGCNVGQCDCFSEDYPSACTIM